MLLARFVLCLGGGGRGVCDAPAFATAPPRRTLRHRRHAPPPLTAAMSPVFRTAPARSASGLPVARWVPVPAGPAAGPPEPLAAALPSPPLPDVCCWQLPLRWPVGPLLAELAPLLSTLRPWPGGGCSGPGGSGGWRGVTLPPTGAGPAQPAWGPLLQGVLAGIPGDVLAVRLLSLPPAAESRYHPVPCADAADGRAGMRAGASAGVLVRFQVLLQGPLDATWELDGQPVPMAPGDCWCLDPRVPQRVRNGGTRERVHLEADCRVNALLRRLLPAP